jgi:hypothetical protein
MADQKISGYRTLSPAELRCIDECKQMEARVLQLLDETQTAGIGLDMRWHHIGRTHIEQGFMAIIRSIAQPEPTQIKE